MSNNNSASGTVPGGSDRQLVQWPPNQGDGDRVYLTKHVPKDLHKSLDRLALYMGTTPEALRGWLDSEQFKPVSERLSTEIEMLDMVGKASPQLRIVIAHIESYEIQWTQGHCLPEKTPNSHTFPLPYHAYTVWQLSRDNIHNQEGIFYHRGVAYGDVQARLWQCLLYARMEKKRQARREEQQRLKRQAEQAEAETMAENGEGSAGGATQ